MLYTQYANSANFQNFLYGGTKDSTPYAGLNNYINSYWRSFYDQIFYITGQDINTAGLDAWGQILGVGRQYQLPTQDKTFGFTVNPGNITDYAQNFDHGSFYSGTGFSILGNTEYKALLILVARTMMSNLSILSITKLLNDFFVLLNISIDVSVAVDSVNPFQINYTFKSGGVLTPLPLWVSYIFSIAYIDKGTFYLPVPIGRQPNLIT